MAACTPSLCQDANTWWKWLLAASCSVPVTHLRGSERGKVFFFFGRGLCSEHILKPIMIEWVFVVHLVPYARARWWRADEGTIEDAPVS